MIYLARHGQTDSNINHVWQGQSGNDGLNETGKSQAFKLAELLSDKNITQIFSSPLNRAHETAQIISDKLNLDVTSDDLLKEMNYGKFEGMSIDEVLKTYEELYNKWKQAPEGTLFPDGESFNDLLSRAKEIVNKYFKMQENILLVSHEDMTRAIIVGVSNKTSEFWLPEIKNTSLTTFDNEKEKIKIISVGQTSHLKV